MLEDRFIGGIGCKNIQKGQLLKNELLVAREVVYPGMKRSSYEYARMTIQEFNGFCSQNKNAYECIVDSRNCCLFFDIDSEIKLTFFLQLLKTQGIHRCIILDSSDFIHPNLPLNLNKLIYSFLKPLKFSYHIICPDQVFNHIYTMKNWVNNKITPFLTSNNIDMPYTKDRIMRIINQTKIGSNRVLRNCGWFLTENFSSTGPALFHETLISTTRNATIFFERAKIVPVSLIQTKSDRSFLSIHRTQDRDQWLRIVSNMKSIGYSSLQVYQWDPRLVHHKGYCDFISQFSRLKTIPCSNARQYLDLFFMNRDFQIAFGLSHCTRRINQRYVSDLVLEKRVTLLKSECGTGKSCLTKGLIKEYINKRILVIISSRALCYDTKRTIDECITKWGYISKFQMYLETNQTLYQDHLIITFQSLWRINVEELEKYDLIILDEMESICQDACSITCRRPYSSQLAFETIMSMKCNTKKE